MAQAIKSTLGGYFETGDTPTAVQFGEMISSGLNLAETTNQAVTGSIVFSGAITTNSVTKGLVSITATDAITATEHAGRTLVLNAADAGSTAVTLTLPIATGTGNEYSFIIGTVNAMTAGYKIQAGDADDTIDGWIIAKNDVANHASNNSINLWKPAAADDTITLDGTTTGGVSIGDHLCLTDIGTNQWVIKGWVEQSGTEATPFSEAVS